MSFVDAIKKSVLENFTGTISVGSIMLSLFVAFVIGLFIIYVYKKTYTGVVYSKAFSLCILMLCMVTAIIIRTISSNISLSLGMVGALSIVRFRTAIKSPIDLLYLFWAISEGIICGVALYMLGFVLCIIMTVLLFILERLPSNRTSNLLILKTNMDINQDELTNKIKSNTKYFKNVSTIIKNKEYELIYEIETKDQTSLIKELNLLSNINSINLVENNGNRRI